MQVQRMFLAALPAVLLVAPSLGAGSKRIPAQLAHARYVALGYDTGVDRFVSEAELAGHGDEVSPGDYNALSTVRELIERTERYIITTRPDEAQLLIAVRTGRRAVANAGAGGFGTGGESRARTFGGELSSSDDMLSVYESSGGRQGALLWREKQASGRPGFPQRLFEQFAADVRIAEERTAKKP
jgi:hypothetical protein